MDTHDLLKKITATQGDITKEHTDAIVNAANASLLGGGGVDGAIHRAAGPKLLEECKELGGCNPGEARLTRGYNLDSSYIIHTPGPIYHGGRQNEETILRNSYWNSMKCAFEKRLSSISFPAISTGIYGYPKKEACKCAVDTVLDFMKEHNYNPDVHFVLFDEENFSLYCTYLKSLGK